MKSIVDLPEDLLVEILSRFSEAFLARLRSTCKEWNALIKRDARLDKKSKIIMLIDSRVYLAGIDLRGSHDDLVKVTSQFSLKDPLSKSLNKEVDIREVFHCDGLLLCITSDNRLVVWNPCSGETSWIQPRDSYKKHGYYALGKSSCNKYKILRIYQHGRTWQCLVEYEIYDFTSNSWRGIGATADWSIGRFMSHGTYVKGNTYWLANTFREEPRGAFLLCFDFSAERFGRVSLPGGYPSDIIFALSVTREEGKLCMLAKCYSPRGIHAWVATEIDHSSGATSWSKFLTVKQSLYYQHFMFYNGMNFLADRENKVLVCRGKHSKSNRLHIVGEDKYIEVDDHEAGSQCSLLLSYIPTMVQIQQERSLG